MWLMGAMLRRTASGDAQSRSRGGARRLLIDRGPERRIASTDSPWRRCQGTRPCTRAVTSKRSGRSSGPRARWSSPCSWRRRVPRTLRPRRRPTPGRSRRPPRDRRTRSAGSTGRASTPRERLLVKPPVIDGRLDDEAWLRQGEWAGQYTQQMPVEGAPPTEPTELKILYDDKNLYFAIRAYDDPDKVHVYPGRRDDFGSTRSTSSGSASTATTTSARASSST